MTQTTMTKRTEVLELLITLANGANIVRIALVKESIWSSMGTVVKSFVQNALPIQNPSAVLPTITRKVDLKQWIIAGWLGLDLMDSVGKPKKITSCSTTAPMVPVAEGVGASKVFVINLFIVVKVILVQLQILLSQVNYLYLQLSGTLTHSQQKRD